MEGAEKHSIYDKLSDEADRIRKWKIETEFDQRIKVFYDYKKKFTFNKKLGAFKQKKKR